jgi:PadR family transcriptional regulator, regulatory protein PadR
MRLTDSVLRVALVLLKEPFAEHWGYDLSRRAGVRSGALYPILDRMLAEGWLEDGWEDTSAVRGGRPRRRYYRVTDTGRSAMGGLVARAATDPRFRLLPGVSTQGA